MDDFNDFKWRMLNGLLMKDTLQADAFYRLSILTYQVGDVHKALVYQTCYCRDDKAVKAFHAEEKIALADALAQLKAFIQLRGYNFDDIDKLAFERMLDFVSRRFKGDFTK